MALQYSVAVRNAQMNSIETTIGTSPKLEFRTGAPPATCATAAAGTLLATLSLPADWLTAAAAGAVAINGGPWTGTGAPAAGAGTAAGHYRITDTAGTTCHEQGTVTGTGGGGDMILDNVSIANGQAINVNSHTLTAANA